MLLSSIFAKLNLKNQRQIVVLNAPESFECELRALHDVKILRNLHDLDEIQKKKLFTSAYHHEAERGSFQLKVPFGYANHTTASPLG